MKPKDLRTVNAQVLGKGKKVNDADFGKHILAGRARRLQHVRKAVAFVLGLLLCFLAMAVGFFVNETLLLISETPYDPPLLTTAPPVSEKTQSAPGTYVQPLRARELTGPGLQTIAAGRAQAKAAREAGADTLAVQLKRKSGSTEFHPAAPAEIKIKAGAMAGWNTQSVLSDLSRNVMPVAAYMHCFADSRAAQASPEMAVLWRGGDTPFRDAAGQRWLNPYSAAARNYLLDLIREVAAMGVQEIILDSVCFPADDLSNAAFPGAENPNDLGARSRVLLDFIAAAKSAVGANVILTVVMPADTAMGGSAAFGGDLWNSVADRVAVDARGADWVMQATWGHNKPMTEIFADVEHAQTRSSYILLNE
jgi:hypothetical protein